jgi:predicted dehydrogenase
MKAKEIVNANGIGNVIGMRIFLSTPRWDMIDLKDHWYHKLPGGVIGETGPHMAYMTMAFLKNIQTADIYAKNNLKKPWAPYDEFAIELEGDNGICSTKLSYTTNYWAAEIDILGTEAFLRVDLEHMSLIKHQLKQQRYNQLGRSAIKEISQKTGSIASNTVKAISGNYKLGTDYVIEKVVDSILNDTQPPVTGEDGRESVRIMEMVVEKYNQKYALK